MRFLLQVFFMNHLNSVARRPIDDQFPACRALVYSYILIISIVTQPIIVCLRKKCKNILLPTTFDVCYILGWFDKSDDYNRAISNFLVNSHRYLQAKVHHRRYHWWQFAAGVNYTCGKFATVINDTCGKKMGTISDCWHLKGKKYLYVNSTSQRCLKNS